MSMTPEQMMEMLNELERDLAKVATPKPAVALSVKADAPTPPHIKEAVEARDSQRLNTAAKPKTEDFVEAIRKSLTPDAFDQWQKEEEKLVGMGYFPTNDLPARNNTVEDGTYVVELRNNVVTDAFRITKVSKPSLWTRIKEFFTGV